MSIETTVQDILVQKPINKIWTIHPDELVYDALTIMAEHNIGALLVMDDGRMVGIISERDYARKVTLQGREARNTRVKEIMVSHVHYVVPSDTAEGCMLLMTEKRIRHLPVLDNGIIVGLISIGDVVKAVNGDHEFMIDQLMHYATGSHVGRYDTLGNNRTMIEIRQLDL